MLKGMAMQTIYYINCSVDSEKYQENIKEKRKKNTSSNSLSDFHGKKDNSCSHIKPGVLLIVVFHQSSMNTELSTQYPVDRKNFCG